jgi:hypothetical protein
MSKGETAHVQQLSDLAAARADLTLADWPEVVDQALELLINR